MSYKAMYTVLYFYYGNQINHWGIEKGYFQTRWQYKEVYDLYKRLKQC